MTQHYRNEDPSTSRLAAESLDLSLKELHYMLLQHHYYHQDSDSNAGFAAFPERLDKLTRDWPPCVEDPSRSTSTD